MPNKKHNKRPLAILSDVEEEREPDPVDSDSDGDSIPSPTVSSRKVKVIQPQPITQKIGQMAVLPEPGITLPNLPMSPQGGSKGVNDLTNLVIALTQAGARLSGKVNNDGRYELDFSVDSYRTSHSQRRAPSTSSGSPRTSRRSSIF
jgi:hypothetical protein